jgi:hypothetical protein
LTAGAVSVAPDVAAPEDKAGFASATIAEWVDRATDLEFEEFELKSEAANVGKIKAIVPSTEDSSARVSVEPVFIITALP